MFNIQRCVFQTAFKICRRELTTGQSVVDKASLSKLRKKTGFSFINCKKALDKFNNDLVQAEEWLREQAQKEGWAKASKLQSRPMSQGLVGMLADERTATMVEVNCETDFVARNSKFISLVSNVTQACQDHFVKQTDRKTILDGEHLGRLVTPSGQTLSDMVALEVGNIGENMALRRAVHLRAADDNFLSTYLHMSGSELSTNSPCHVGKFGALVEIQQLPEETNVSSNASTADSGMTIDTVTDDSGEDTDPVSQDTDPCSQDETGDVEEDCDDEPLPLDQICRHLGQHIVGMNPKKIGDPEDKPKDSLEEDKTLIYQEYLLDPSVRVGSVLRKYSLAVRDFVRFECGEDLDTPEEKDD